MQADAGLVEDVEYIDELRTYLGGKADALAFSTRQGDGRAVKRQVIQAYIEQEAETALDFLQDFAGDEALFLFKIRFYIFQPVVQFVDIHRSQLVDVLVVDAEMKGFLVQAGPLAIGTSGGLGKLVGPLLCGGRSILFLHHLDVLHDAFVGGEIIGGGMDKVALYLDAFVRAMEYILDGFVGKLLQWGV